MCVAQFLIVVQLSCVCLAHLTCAGTSICTARRANRAENASGVGRTLRLWYNANRRVDQQLKVSATAILNLQLKIQTALTQHHVDTAEGPTDDAGNFAPWISLAGFELFGVRDPCLLYTSPSPRDRG